MKKTKLFNLNVNNVKKSCHDKNIRISYNALIELNNKVTELIDNSIKESLLKNKKTILKEHIL